VSETVITPAALFQVREEMDALKLELSRERESHPEGLAAMMRVELQEFRALISQSMTERLHDFDMRLRKLEHALSKVDVSEHEDRLDDHERRIDSVSASVDAMRSMVATMNHNIDRLLAEVKQTIWADREAQVRRDRDILAALERVAVAHQHKVVE